MKKRKDNKKKRLNTTHAMTLSSLNDFSLHVCSSSFAASVKTLQSLIFLSLSYSFLLVAG
jgi:hypothetical protein